MGLLACLHMQTLRVNAARSKGIVVNSSERPTGHFRAIERDLWAPTLPKFDKVTMASSYRLLQGEGRPEDSVRVAPIRAMAQELLEADCVVISTPVWNHSVPYVVKQYMDCVVQPELTFSKATQEPFVQGKSFVLVTSAGGEIREEDTTFALVKSVFSSIGFNHGHVITLQGLKDPVKREAQTDAALFEAERIAQHIVEYNKK
ncbi:Aste57867_11641 [Aphanomyces stellatus]|uniref:Aste57867_11641 protein n=1 Tax=Aphanomyces stellatus TaxID=120398 RepID=A0A485KU26_9STRA|nr:hypothetical protein As57867_011598 [Aphanomyces stellatus]VFT88499.1 Aste57867_11641 [Aphanomyces stellatus]